MISYGDYIILLAKFSMMEFSCFVSSVFDIIGLAYVIYN